MGRHLPQFTKGGHGNPPGSGRRAHRLTPKAPPAASVLASAEKRKRQYQHSHARAMDAFVAALDAARSARAKARGET